MQTYRFDELSGVDGLRPHDEPIPVPQRGELLLRVRAVALNYRDIAIAGGGYVRSVVPGLIPCSDATADVVEVGAGVDDYTAGDRVLSTFHPRWFGGPIPATAETDSYGSGQDGWLCQYKVVSREAVVPLPAAISYEQGATLPCAGLTAWSALTGAQPIRPGQQVLTLGTGGVSVFAVQLAKGCGARVIATTSSDAKADRLRELGADAVVNYATTPEWGDVVRSHAGGRGVDRVVEVGGPATINQSLRAVAAGGEIALIGFLTSDNPGIDYFALKGSGATTRPITVGDRAELQSLVAAVQSLRIDPVIDCVIDFADAATAFQRVADGQQFGKIVIRL